METADHIPLGVGFYARAEAARLLKVHPTTLNRWVRGYTYRLRHEGQVVETRKKQPVVRIYLPPIDNVLALSFVELIELRVIKAFIEKGLPLQRIRVAAERALEVFNTAHAFASRRVFTDGQTIFAELTAPTDSDGDYHTTIEAGIPNIIELTRNRHLQVHAGCLLEGHLDEISFSQETLLADRWWPLSKDFPIVLDPKIAFGAPVIEGTATRTDVVAGTARAMSSDAAANVYQLKKREVEAAVQFEDLLAAA
jgi:uncharacterized protein (DUF433 family)